MFAIYGFLKDSNSTRKKIVDRGYLFMTILVSERRESKGPSQEEKETTMATVGELIKALAEYDFDHEVQVSLMTSGGSEGASLDIEDFHGNRLSPTIVALVPEDGSIMSIEDLQAILLNAETELVECKIHQNMVGMKMTKGEIKDSLRRIQLAYKIKLANVRDVYETMVKDRSLGLKTLYNQRAA